MTVVRVIPSAIYHVVSSTRNLIFIYTLHRVRTLVHQSTLCQMIIEGLKRDSSYPVKQKQWFVRWLWTTTVGSVLYALLAVGFRCCRCCRSSPSAGVSSIPDDVEMGVRRSTFSRGRVPAVNSIVTSFDAWLFADSKVLWAVLVSKIFEQVSRYKRRC